MKRVYQIMVRSVFFCMLVLFVASVVCAQDLPDEEYDILIPRDIVAVRPDDGGPPTQVSVGIFVVNLVTIDEPSESFRVDFCRGSKKHGTGRLYSSDYSG